MLPSSHSFFYLFLPSFMLLTGFFIHVYTWWWRDPVNRELNSMPPFFMAPTLYCRYNGWMDGYTCIRTWIGARCRPADDHWSSWMAAIFALQHRTLSAQRQYTLEVQLGDELMIDYSIVFYSFSFVVLFRSFVSILAHFFLCVPHFLSRSHVIHSFHQSRRH